MIKKIIASSLIISFLTTPLFASNYQKGYLQGIDDAKENHSSLSWAIGSFLSIITVVGPVVCYVMADTDIFSEAPDVKPEFRSDFQYRTGYSQGYAKIAKSKNKKSVFRGAVFGISTWFVGYLKKHE